MKQYYSLAVFKPDQWESTCVIHYYCCYSVHDCETPSESYWVVPGTWEL